MTPPQQPDPSPHPSDPPRGSLDEALSNGWHLLAGDPAGAERQAREILRIDKGEPRALRLLARALRRQERALTEAVAAERDAVAATSGNPVLVEAAIALRAERFRDAEMLIRPYRRRHPDDPVAALMLADIANSVGAFDDAEALLREALDLAPSYTAAANRLVQFHARQGRWRDAVDVLGPLIAEHPGDQRLIGTRAAAVVRLGDYAAALADYELALSFAPERAPIWMSYGHTLKTVGRLDDAVSAYRKAVSLAPSYGEVWWSLANLKTFRFSDDDVRQMRVALADTGLDADARLHLHFALGKALEDSAAFGESFEQYREGNRLRRGQLPYSAEETDADVDRAIRLFAPLFFEARADRAAPAQTPIFIIGMPRAGSTLTEQILASHAAVEGLAELPHLPLLVQKLIVDPALSATGDYPDLLAAMDDDRLRAIGDAYLSAVQPHRRTDRPYFIDKLPNNWMHVGLIRLALPHAKVIDVRRNPLDCCFSNFKQHFANGQPFAYGLEDIGRYYRTYVRMMRHYDAVLPGRVHRLLYEELLAAPEREIRSMLDYLGLEFDVACLAFDRNRRAVRTASAEQVRRPLNRDGVGQWRHYADWLAPLREALGPVIDNYVS